MGYGQHDGNVRNNLSRNRKCPFAHIQYIWLYTFYYLLSRIQFWAYFSKNPFLGVFGHGQNDDDVKIDLSRNRKCPIAHIPLQQLAKNKIFFKFRKNYFIKVTKHVEYEKNIEKNSSLIFWPVGPLDWAKTWKKWKNRWFLWKFFSRGNKACWVWEKYLKKSIFNILARWPVRLGQNMEKKRNSLFFIKVNIKR